MWSNCPSSQGDRVRTRTEVFLFPASCSSGYCQSLRAGLRRDSSSNPGNTTSKLGDWSWCSGLVAGLSLWGGRAEFSTLVHQRPPSPSWYQSARALPETSNSMLRPSSLNDQQDPVLDSPRQTTSKTGTQTHPLPERLPKIIISSQTPQNTPPDAVLPTRKTRSSLIHQNTGTSPLHQEAYTTHWTNLTHWGQTPKKNGNYESAACEKETPNTVS